MACNTTNGRFPRRGGDLSPIAATAAHPIRGGRYHVGSTATAAGPELQRTELVRYRATQNISPIQPEYERPPGCRHASLDGLASPPWLFMLLERQRARG
jgi:hypothetical protein